MYLSLLVSMDRWTLLLMSRTSKEKRVEMATTKSVLAKIQELQETMDTARTQKSDLRMMASTDSQKALIAIWEVDLKYATGFSFGEPEQEPEQEQTPPIEKGVNL